MDETKWCVLREADTNFLCVSPTSNGVVEFSEQTKFYVNGLKVDYSTNFFSHPVVQSIVQQIDGDANFISLTLLYTQFTSSCYFEYLILWTTNLLLVQILCLFVS